MELTFEFNEKNEAVEVYGDKEGLKLLIKRLSSLVSCLEGSYISHECNGNKHHRDNLLANHYLIYMTNRKPALGLKEMGPQTPSPVPRPQANT